MDLVLDKVLTEMTEIDGVIGVILSDKDGLVIESALKRKLDKDAIAGVLHELVAGIKLVGDQFSAGNLKEVIIEYANARMFVTPIGGDYYLVIIGESDLNLGRIKLELRKVVPRLTEMLS